MLFQQHDDDLLADHIDRLLQDKDMATRLAMNAQKKVKRFHTVEHRVQQILEWLRSGREPDYGDASTRRSYRK